MLAESLCSHIPGNSGVNLLVNGISVDSETKVSLSKKHPVVVLMSVLKVKVTCTDAEVCCTENEPKPNLLNNTMLAELNIM